MEYSTVGERNIEKQIKIRQPKRVVFLYSKCGGGSVT